MVLTSESVLKTPKCDHSNEAESSVFISTDFNLPVVFFLMLNEVVLTFELVVEILIVAIQIKAVEQYFPVVAVFVLQHRIFKTKFGNFSVFNLHTFIDA